MSIVLLTVTGFPAHAQTISFTDVSETAGLATAGVGHGVSVHDYDDDGWEDVFISTLSGSSRLFRNSGDASFTDVTIEAGLGGIGAYAVALWGDVDNDGLTDLFLGRGHSGLSRLFRNVGGGVFEDISDKSGLDRQAPIATGAFGDVDGDGAIDLFVTVHGRTDLLYRNTGDAEHAVFEDVSAAAGIGGPIQAVPMQATWADYDRDGYLDLFAVHDGRLESRLYDYDGSWPLRDVAFTSGIRLYPDASVCCNMGTAWGDFDGDGWLDAYVTRIGTGGLFRNNGDGTFTDEAEARGADRNGMSWGVVWLDADNDGDLDLFIVSTSGYDGTPTLLFENEGGTFTEIGRSAGASFYIDARGLASGDFNGDGRTDLVIASTDGRNRLLLSTTENAGHWAKVDLRGRTVNADAIGTRIEVVAGGKTHVRTVSGGDSYASQSAAPLHIGLGRAAQIDTLRIVWTQNRVQEMTGLPVDSSYVVAEALSASSRSPRDVIQPDLDLKGMYPNPVRDALHIDFFTRTYGVVRIDIFDALGRRVAGIGAEVLPPGRHQKVLDVRSLPSGSYFFRLRSGNRVIGRGLLVLR